MLKVDDAGALYTFNSNFIFPEIYILFPLSEGFRFQPLTFLWVTLTSLFLFFCFFHLYAVINNSCFKQIKLFLLYVPN